MFVVLRITLYEFVRNCQIGVLFVVLVEVLLLQNYEGGRRQTSNDFDACFFGQSPNHKFMTD